jgi:hypothetical protein
MQKEGTHRLIGFKMCPGDNFTDKRLMNVRLTNEASDYSTSISRRT